MTYLQAPMQALAILALVLVLSPRFNHPLYRGLLFHPRRYEPGADQLPTIENCDASEVFLNLKTGKTIHGWLFEVPGATQAILFSHGNAGNLSSRIDLVSVLLQTGASVFVYDYEGFGKSNGAPSTEGICANGLAAFDYLVNEKMFSPQDIVVYGESLGAAVATYISSQRECGGIILQSGFSSLRRIALEIFPFLAVFPGFLWPSQKLDNLSLLKQKHAPLLIIHGVNDCVVPYSHAERLFSQASDPKQLLTLEETAHNNIFSTAAEPYRETIRAFLKSCTKSA